MYQHMCGKLYDYEKFHNALYASRSLRILRTHSNEHYDTQSMNGISLLASI